MIRHVEIKVFNYSAILNYLQFEIIFNSTEYQIEAYINLILTHNISLSTTRDEFYTDSCIVNR